MYDRFKNLYSAENTINDDTAFNNSDLQDEELDKDITMPELREAIFCQRNNKSSGPDEISTEIYKCAFEDTSPFIVKLFNRLISNGEYPTCFGEGIIHPIHKGGDKNNPKNYRGITLINILSKIYSQLILNRRLRAGALENITKSIWLSKEKVYHRLHIFSTFHNSKNACSWEKLLRFFRF